MNEQELNMKLAEWAGFRMATQQEYSCGSAPRTDGWWGWFYPDGQTKWYLPDFTQSLDACFKWLVPKLQNGHCELDTGMMLKGCKCMARVGRIWHGVYGHTEAYNDSPTLALCLAIEKLIDTEVSNEDTTIHD